MVSTHRSQGFTLVELIVVIVLLGIVGTFSFSYLGFGAKIFSDAVGRDQLMSQSRFAVERLSRELRNALPRSVRVDSNVNGSCIELVPIISSSSYVQLPQPGASSDKFFEGVTPIAEPGSVMVGQYLYVYATNAAMVYNSNSPRRKVIDTITPHSSNSNLSVFSFVGNPKYFPKSSPARRFFITEQPVSWCVTPAGELQRFSDYGFHNNQRSLSQLVSLGGPMEVMAKQLNNNLADSSQAPFTASASTLQRSSLVLLDLRFGRANDTEPLRIQHEVFVPNVP
ncbi:hypothetical protein CWE15_05380 [Aliidiomarina taiwanensis]|uniref:MSHA biogenesis protein MshO n=1 Tax=Aliidiomarina taiwanensis TaxID=946228 RepID=A0A432X7P7_9GAMM|nr:type II secretion system protein [Aliidiomarina taiwanensis]RUO42836.1 hypothetical protein CWE15_05380 [Aliidiomarina taiwanensis]